MDFLDALEEMARRCDQIVESYCCPDNVERWMRVFRLSYAQAEKAIESHLDDLSRVAISDEQWALLRANPETEGHDKESYAYHLTRSKSAKKAAPPPAKRKGKQLEYLLKLEHPLDTAEKVQNAANLSITPKTLVDEESSTTKFVIVDATARATIEELLHPAQLSFTPLKRPAEKDLSNISIAPTLGIDATLPQHRTDTPSLPHQDQYPVPYFFYGTLAEPDRLSRLLSLDHEPIFKPATIRRGKLKTWLGKYRALADGSHNDLVSGWVYVVDSKEHEDALRHYEGSNYEVVRCDMIVDGSEVIQGLTFRFCGDEQLLR